MAFQVIKRHYDFNDSRTKVEFICIVDEYKEAMQIVEDEFNSTWFEFFGDDGDDWFDDTYEYFLSIEELRGLFFCGGLGFEDAVAIDRADDVTIWFILDTDEPNVEISF